MGSDKISFILSLVLVALNNKDFDTAEELIKQTDSKLDIFLPQGVK